MYITGSQLAAGRGITVARVHYYYSILQCIIRNSYLIRLT
jgi:hypothetical protein